jgi:prepilin-type N-terminal cleavage/methylation domain-containing protein
MNRLVARMRRNEKGLTLIETMAALTIFAIITLGLTPLLASAMRGAGVSRSYTVGKNLASQSMERIRGLPYFESVQGLVTPARRDVLDLYFPDLGAGYDSATGKFTTICTQTSKTPAASAPLACPRELPNGYEVRFVARFVEPGPDPVPPNPQTFNTRAPDANYNWNATATESPPTQLLEMTVISNWKYGDRARTFSLSSLIGQRHLSNETIRGSGRVYFTVQVLSALEDPNGQPVSVVSTGGTAGSAVATRSLAAADQETRTAYVTLTEEEFAGNPATTVANESGASAFLHAPPNSFLAPSVNEDEKLIEYEMSDGSDFEVARFDDTRAENHGVQVLNELPKSQGSFRFSGGVGLGNDPSFWVDNQADRGLTSELLIHPLDHVFAIERDASARLAGQTSAQATAVSSAARRVEGHAEASFGKLFLIPTTFVTSLERTVIVVRDFQASLTCYSTANPVTSSVTGEWSATLSYWRDREDIAPNDGVALGQYVDVPVSGTIGSADPDPLAALKTTNPRVYDAVDDSKDVFLFEETDADGNVVKKGYLRELVSTPAPEAFEDGTGRESRVNLDAAIRIDTAPMTPGVESTAMSVSIGKLSCEAVDKRGL